MFMRGTKRTRWAVAVTAVCFLVTLSACSRDDPGTDGTPTPTSAVTTPPPTTPTTIPTPTTLPAAAKADKAGAEAFVRYFWDVFNYTYESGDTRLLRSISDKTCKFCQSVVDHVDGLTAK